MPCISAVSASVSFPKEKSSLAIPSHASGEDAVILVIWSFVILERINYRLA